jgi:hypothetical protein
MALIADLSDPYSPAPAPGRLSAPIANEFPTPPSAWGFLASVDAQMEHDGVSGQYGNAFHPEGTHLEPTIGQIWPR